jgi:hypothetical protein
VRQSKTADLLIRGLAISAQVLRRLQAGISVSLQELQEILTLDEVELARLPGFCGDLVRRS